MLNQLTIMVADQRIQDLVEEADREHRLDQLLQDQRDHTPFYAPLLDHLGHLLIETGLNLRSRYGQLEWRQSL